MRNDFMEYNEHKISDTRNQIVKSVYWLESESALRPLYFLPDGTPELMVADVPISVHTLQKKRIISGKELLWGQIRFSGIISCPGPYRIFGVKFQPWALRLIWEAHLPVPVDRIIPARDIIPAAILEYVNDLLQLEQIGDVWPGVGDDLVADHMNSVLAKAEITEKLKMAINTLVVDSGIRIASLVPAYNQSLRTLEHHFFTYTGLRPKAFQKILRLRRVSEGIKRGDTIVQAALEAGFYDQPHFNRAFSRMTLQKPSEFPWDKNLVLSSL